MRKFTQIEFCRTSWAYTDHSELVSYLEFALENVRVETLPEYGIMSQRVSKLSRSDHRAYDDLVDFLVSLLRNPNLHWFYTASTVGILEIVLKVEKPLPASLVTSVLEYGVLSDIRAGIISFVLRFPVRYVSMVLLKRLCMFIKDRSAKILNTSRVSNLKRNVDFKKVLSFSVGENGFSKVFGRACSGALFTKDEWNQICFIGSCCCSSCR